MTRPSLPLLILLAVIIFIVFLFLSPYINRLRFPFYYRQEITTLAKEYDFSPAFIAAIVKVESKFTENAVSNRGARGLMQIMPSTAFWIAQEWGLENFDVEMLFDPEVNLRMGIWYLANLKREFSSVNPALAAYNAGRGNVAKWLAEGRWDGTLEQIEGIPFAETRNYIRKVWDGFAQYEKIYPAGSK